MVFLSEGFKKSPADDGINMRTGIFGWKGEVSFHIGRPLAELVADQGLSSELLLSVEAIAAIIDREIHSHYKLFPINYIALDLIDGVEHHYGAYTEQEKSDVLQYIESRIDLVRLPESLAPDREYLRRCLLMMYANPVLSKLKTELETRPNLEP